MKCNVDVRYKGRLITINVSGCLYESATVIKGKQLEITDRDKKNLINLAKKKIKKSTRCTFCS